METQTQPADLHQQLSDWKKDVILVRNDVRSLRSRLEESSPQLCREYSAEVEHFQNQFILQLEVADEMLHELKQADKQVFGSPSSASAVSARQQSLSERMETFKDLFFSLKSDFDQFLESSV